MKKSFWLLLFNVGLGVSTYAQNSNNQPKYSYDDLQPSQTQQKVEQFVTQFLSNYHYKKFEINDSLSSKIWDNYFKEIDGGRSYFTKAEVESFEKYRYTIDESLLSGDLTGPFEVFNLYRKKYKKRYHFIKELLEKPLDFTTNETYNVDRDEEPWVNSEAELDDIWRKLILGQALGMKLSGSKDSAIVSTLNKRYDMYEVRVAKWRAEDIFQTFLNSFTEVIDPHTNYMIPSAAAQFNIDMSQSLEGIGASLKNEGDYVMISDIIPGGPLFKSEQATKNDNIIAVAQGDEGEFQDIIGWLTDDAVKLIRGKKGTIVRLKILPSDAPAGSEPKIIRLEREKIKLEEAVATSKIIDFKHDKKDYKIGVIDIPMFYRDFEGARNGGDFQSTTKDVKRFLDEYKTKKIDGVMIDLRNNGGGSLTEAITLTGLFIKDGPVVQRRSSRGKVDVENDRDVTITYNGPLMILQNRFSASASEIFAGAIQDYKRGLIVGEQSYGKGTVQQLVDLDQFLLSPKTASRDNKKINMGFEEKERYGQLKLTTEKFYRITGNSTQRKGVSPDVNLPSPFDPEEMGESSQSSALAYDEVEKSEFEKTNFINEKLIQKLNSKFESRLRTDDELKDLNDDLAEYREIKDKKVYSLNYEIRKKEKEDTEEKRKAVKRLAKSNGKSDKADSEDIYLEESKRILCDLIAINK